MAYTKKDATLPAGDPPSVYIYIYIYIRSHFGSSHFDSGHFGSRRFGSMPLSPALGMGLSVGALSVGLAMSMEIQVQAF